MCVDVCVWMFVCVYLCMFAQPDRNRRQLDYGALKCKRVCVLTCPLILLNCFSTGFVFLDSELFDSLLGGVAFLFVILVTWTI